MKIILSIVAFMASEAVIAHEHRDLNNVIVSNPDTSKGRLLASNCFQCHNTQGVGGFDRLVNHTQLSIFAEMIEKRMKEKNKEMNIHAKGYTKEQLWDISGYLSNITVQHKQ